MKTIYDHEDVIDEDGFTHSCYEEWVGHPMMVCTCGHPSPCPFIRLWDSLPAAGVSTEEPNHG